MSVGQEFNCCPTCGRSDGGKAMDSYCEWHNLTHDCDECPECAAYNLGYADGSADQRDALLVQYARLAEAINELAEKVKAEAG